MNTSQPRNREADALLMRTCFSNAELYGLACVFMPAKKKHSRTRKQLERTP
jgi:hypothetical protein